VWARLYVGVGSRDDIRKGDLVGAIAGEAEIPGAKIGKIEIRDSFSIVEVEAGVADRVIQAVNGTTLKGRSVRVDYDRSGDRARRGGGDQRLTRGPGAQRRSVRRPPRGD
jgi:ATP-dependent RNA helicase DeaD